MNGEKVRVQGHGQLAGRSSGRMSLNLTKEDHLNNELIADLLDNAIDCMHHYPK